jgi:putative Holliday junction resolvase
VRIIALDIGAKRTGIAVTDPLQMIATGLEGINTHELVPFLTKYTLAEQVETIVVGQPKQMDYTDSESWEQIQQVVKKITEALGHIQLEYYDERFTSKIAMQSMKMAGANKKDMKNKKTVDMISATVLLQSYLEHKSNFKVLK